MNKYDFVKQLCTLLQSVNTAIINSNLPTEQLLDIMNKMSPITDLLLAYVKE